MPELPEVETVVRAARPHLVGRRIVRVRTRVARLRAPLRLEGNRALLGQRIVAVRRRAKNILVELANRQVLLLHLGMTGTFRIEADAGQPRPHDRVIFYLDDGRRWVFEDPRRFGHIALCAIPRPGATPACLAGLAPEPFAAEFSVPWLAAACRGRQRPIKNVIMDNALVVGVGNIYASESLFRAGIHPATPAGRLTRPRLAGLHAAIRQVLRAAIRAGGTTIINFHGVDGEEGRFWRRLRVYDRTGERCRRCRRGRVRRTVMAGRSTYHCPVCQRSAGRRLSRSARGRAAGC